jgi:hypothetical protein
MRATVRLRTRRTLNGEDLAQVAIAVDGEGLEHLVVRARRELVHVHHHLPHKHAPLCPAPLDTASHHACRLRLQIQRGTRAEALTARGNSESAVTARAPFQQGGREASCART